MEKKASSRIFLHIFFFSLTFTTITAKKMPISIKVGLVLDMDHYIGQMSLNCISMALSDFYSTHKYYKTRIALVNRDSKGDIVEAAAEAVYLLKNVQVQAIIGPLFSEQANFMIALGDKAHVPVITFSATSPSLSSLRSSYFIRAIMNDSSQVHAISAIIQAYGWREVVLVYEDNVFGEGIVPFLTDTLEHVNVCVPYRSVIPSLATDNQIFAELYKLMTMQTRVFVVHMRTSIGSRLFTKAKQLGLMSEDYVWIITDGMSNEINSIDHTILDSMFGVIGVKPFIPNTKELNDFTIRYKKRIKQNNPTVHRPHLNIYGLWAYDTAIAFAMATEKAKLGKLRFRKANISRNSTNLEAFGVSNADPNFLRALSSTSFNGLSGKFELVDGQLQSPPYQIINVVGHKDRVIGYWTKDNGIIRDLNLRSKKTNSYSTHKSNFRSTIWPGNKTSPAKGWVFPTNGKKLKIGVPVKDGFAQFVRVTWNSDNLTTVEGYSIDIFDAVMKALPYGVAYEYIPFATSDHKMAGNYNDLVYQVYLGNYDVIVGDVTILANRSQYVDFTLPYMESSISMIVPFKDDETKNTWVFLKPLTWELWLTSFLSFVFIGFIIWILEHRINKQFRGPPRHHVGMIFWFAFSTMVFSHKEKVVSNLARFVLIIWFLVVLILTQSYTASFTSMLTVQQLQPTVEDINVLLKNKEYIGYKTGSFVHEFLKKMKFDDSRLVPVSSAEQIDELFSKGNIAAVMDEIPFIKIFLTHYCSKYTMVGPIYKADGFGFVFPIGSPLVTDVSRAILNVTDDTKIMEIQRKWFGDKTCPDSSILLSHENSLGLGSFWGLFLIVGVAGIAALLIYVIMFLHENWHVVEHSNPELSIWSKIVELLHIFDNKDLKSHTFKDIKARDREHGCGGVCMDMANNTPSENYQQSSFSLASPGPSLIFSSPSKQDLTLQKDQGTSTGNAAENTENEASQMINHEIELTIRMEK